MSWKLSVLNAPIPKDDIETFLGAMDTASSTVKTLLDAIGVALEIIKPFVSIAPDPFSITIQVLFDALDAFINDFFASGAYYLAVTPFDVQGTKKYDAFGFPLLYPAEAIEAAVMSFEDLGDINRPVFSDSAEVSALGIMVTVESVPKCMDILKALTAVFSMPEWTFALKEMQSKTKTIVPSVKPDWKSWRLNTTDQMSIFQDVLLGLSELLRGWLTVPDTNIADLIDAIERKANSLSNSITAITDLVHLLTKSLGGVYILDLPKGVGGSKRIKQALRDEFLENCKPTNGYTFLTLFVGGGATVDIVDNIRKLMV